MAKKMIFWECDECQESYDTEKEANSCCKKEGQTRGDPIVRLI